MNNYIRYIVITIISAILVFASLWAADNINGQLSAIFISVPIALLVTMVISSDVVDEYIFGLFITRIVYLAAVFITFYLIIYAGLDKYTGTIIGFLVWILLTVILYWIYRKNPPSFLEE